MAHVAAPGPRSFAPQLETAAGTASCVPLLLSASSMHHLAAYRTQVGPEPTKEQVAQSLRLLRHKNRTSRPTTPMLHGNRKPTSANPSPSDAPLLSWSSRGSPRRTPQPQSRTPELSSECLHTSKCRCQACRIDYHALEICPPQPTSSADVTPEPMGELNGDLSSGGPSEERTGRVAPMKMATAAPPALSS